MSHLQIKYVILINCGGTIDVVENLEPEEHVVFFIADSHRPTDVCNIYSLNDQVCQNIFHSQVEDVLFYVQVKLNLYFQIRLLCKADPEEKVPEFYDIFKDDDDDDESINVSSDLQSCYLTVGAKFLFCFINFVLNQLDEEISDEDDEDNVNAESRAAKRLRMDEHALNKRAWEKTRRRLLFEYMQFSYYGRSVSDSVFRVHFSFQFSILIIIIVSQAAILMYELSWQLHRDNVDLLW